jgi:hypothetical protein
MVGGKGGPVIVTATVPRNALLFYDNERREEEVIPEAAPLVYSVTRDQDIITMHARQREEQRDD